MIKRIVEFVRAYIRGDEATLKGEIVLSWWEVGAILIIIGLVIYLICR
jgi:hypothetical protein